MSAHSVVAEGLAQHDVPFPGVLANFALAALAQAGYAVVKLPEPVHHHPTNTTPCAHRSGDHRQEVPVQTARRVGDLLLDHRTTVADITNQGGQVVIAIHEAGTGCRRTVTCTAADLAEAIGSAS